MALNSDKVVVRVVGAGPFNENYSCRRVGVVLWDSPIPIVLVEKATLDDEVELLFSRCLSKEDFCIN